MIRTGIIADDTRHTRGWLMGAFPGAPINHDSCEVKFVTYRKGMGRPWVYGSGATTLMIVTDGLINNYIGLSPSSCVNYLVLAGEWLLWSGEEGHDSTALEDSTVVVVRWR